MLVLFALLTDSDVLFTCLTRQDGWTLTNIKVDILTGDRVYAYFSTQWTICYIIIFPEM